MRLLALVCCLAGCATTAAPDAVGDTGAAESSGVDAESSGSPTTIGTDGASSAADTTTDTDASVDADEAAHELCARLIDCYRDGELPGVTGLLASYGEDGTCWATPGVLPSDCANECAALLEAAMLTYPDVAACGECSADDECAWSEDRPYCNDDVRLCTANDCGNGIVESGEDCDGAIGCTSSCVWSPGCGMPLESGGDCFQDCECISGMCETVMDESGQYTMCVDCITDDHCGPDEMCTGAWCEPYVEPTSDPVGDCLDCAVDFCLAQAVDCGEDPGCNCLAECAGDELCGVPAMCYEQCGVESNAMLDAMFECVVAGCGDVCGC